MKQKIPYHHLLFALLYSVVTVSLVGSASAEIYPEQVAIVANKLNDKSVSLAKDYAAARKIPERHILFVEMGPEETIGRTDYENKIVAPLRKQLRQKELLQQVRVLVTMYGVPLRVSAPESTDEDKQAIIDARERQKTARSLLLSLIDEADKIAADAAPVEKAPLMIDAPNDPDVDKKILIKASDALTAAARRIKELGEPEKEQGKVRNLTPLMVRFAGLAALIPTESEEKAGKEAGRTLGALKKEVSAAAKLLRVLDQTTDEKDRQRAYGITERVYGLAGVLNRAASEIQVRGNENGDASVDSELALLWWDRSMYRVSGRLPNPLHYKALKNKEGKKLYLPILMVSRLDAPDPANVQTMYRGAMLAEHHGLGGNVYSDSRGLKFTLQNEFSRWDQDIRDFAVLMRKKSGLAVIADDNEKLLSDGEDTAVYVGWYQLRNFNDVFTFAPGAIGYHIASEEAVSVHEPAEKGWCKNMLERGISATIGAVAEPYLDSFPLPQKFFALMLDGSYSLVEAYYLTTKYISWRMVLFGDPLYNPWRGKKLATVSEIEERIPGLELGENPPQLGTLEVGDPVEASRRIKAEQKKLHGQLEGFFKQVEKQGAQLN